MYAFGFTTAALHLDDTDMPSAAAGIVMVLCVQLVAQYSNEYWDVDADSLNHANRTWFSGGSGVLPTGVIPRRAALTAARVFALLAVLTMLALLWSGRPFAALIGLLGLPGSWFYSAPPLRWTSSGWGELIASAIVSLLVPLAGAISQTGSLFPELFFAVPFLMLHWAMVIALSLPDMETDRAAGKMTLAVRLGQSRTVQLHHLLIAGAYLLGVLLSLWMTSGGWLFLASAPIAAVHIALVRRNRPAEYNWLTLTGVASFASCAALTLLGLVLSAR